MRSVVVVVVLCSLLGGCCTSELHSYAPNHIIENPSQIRSECAKQVLRISGLKVHRLCMQRRTRLTHRPSDRASDRHDQPTTTHHPRSSRLCVHVCVPVHNRNCVNKNVINYMCVLGGLSLIRCQDLGGQAGRSVSGGVWYRHKCNPPISSIMVVGRTRLLRYPCDCEYYIILSVHRV